ncbi:MAG: DEAD/DEAH box helicase [Candidatus Omnitrophota bacterium]
MELKEYQQKTLRQIKDYLTALTDWKSKSDKIAKEHGAETAFDWTEKAWEKVKGNHYQTRKNGLGEYLPNLCLKIPTGGGKTLLAVKSIDLINTIFRKKRTGLILWVVPTTQIYRQTIEHLRDREHPYRQHLDIASGGQTLIVEKTDQFTPLDVAQNLVVLMLMLPSASRQNKETLKVFRDSGGFQAFFPPEDDTEAHRKLLVRFPNLDVFGSDNGFWGKQIKTSLGNTLRTLSPVIILDEGHKAYSETAQKTLRGFNPCLILELSATPPGGSNVLVDIKGIELSREDMIKLDLHIINKASVDWKDTMLSSIEKRNALEEKAKEYEANTGEHIRPICLIQVERTGKDQRGGRYIHAEDVKEYLIKTCGISESAIAIKTSEKDDIEGIDLFASDCRVRYIITKQALQEGWDCSFAYVLTILTNPTSQNNLTQLVGRILRQPFARKTKIKDLDESYVFCFQQRGKQLLESIKDGFEQEGLGDLTGRVITDESPEGGTTVAGERIIEVREKFKKFANHIYLPVFVIQDGKGWRKLSYETDVISLIDWANADFKSLHSLPLSLSEEKDTEIAVGLSDDEKEVIESHGVLRLKEGGLAIDTVFVTRHLIDIIPNPWIAYEVAQEVLNVLIKKNDLKAVANNLVFIIEEMRKLAEQEKDRLAQRVFADLITGKQIRFLMLKDDQGYRLPSKMKIRKSSKRLTCRDGGPLQRSLFEIVAEDELNDTEKAVAWYLEDQERLFWWYRNLSRQDYAIQGWRKHRIYPDFIFSEMNGKGHEDFDKVFVVETKGLHLKGSEDTKYKQDVFSVCNKLAEERSWTELGLSLPERKIIFEVVSEDEWQQKINEMLAVRISSKV